MSVNDSADIGLRLGGYTFRSSGGWVNASMRGSRLNGLDICYDDISSCGSRWRQRLLSGSRSQAGANDRAAHGFPCSSREFDTIIPLLATRYHLVAPDFPSFGQSDSPPPSSYAYTFDHLAETTNGLIDQLKKKMRFLPS